MEPCLVAPADRARAPVLPEQITLSLSETAVAVVVSSPHRADAFAAALSCIDRVKESVPIWKKEHWSDGSDWATGSQPIRARAVTSVTSHEGGVNAECSS